MEKSVKKSAVDCDHPKANCSFCGHKGCIYGGCPNEIYWWDESKMLDYPSGCIRCKEKNTIQVIE